ncbi:hypothetical protein L228DRAFT_159483 [Xylona heveae TC161]|uniref:Integral membrane protein S linking to the trans Golgi network-domain-containing protein n=1 Tax=Xylona heveae (strain CBS 132557 / TC161) TaxID=1328760 RepID=A0A165G5M6_XYLHT|nr:hypothetical protein L228DRAFT_159483 [Xylona heveae TC161]KZF21764.1 hypothetical protein L228DRAFT_159483 [Xylona heveae TC161]
MPRRPRRPPRAGALGDLPPLKILSQIVMLQAAYYASAAVMIIFTALVAGKRVHLDLILSWQTIRGDTTVGWTLGLVWMLNSLVSVIYVLLLIARSKLVLDFVLTLHFINLLVTSFYTHAVPRNWLWWALQVSSAGLMTCLGIWSCQWRELQPINLGKGGAGSGSSTNANSATATTIPDPALGSSKKTDEGVGVEYGRGKGRGGRDGGGNYEMVGMSERGDNIV